MSDSTNPLRVAARVTPSSRLSFSMDAGDTAMGTIETLITLFPLCALLVVCHRTPGKLVG
jgi:hypothetical protein